MTKIVDELLVKLGVDPSKWKTGLSEATRASNSFVQGLKEHQAALNGLTLTSGLTLAGQIAFIKKATDAAEEQLLATSKLENNLKSDQRTRADSIDVLRAQATELQKVTRFDDEQTVASQAMLAGFGLTDQQILAITPHLQDAAEQVAFLNNEEVDLGAVTKAVGKAIETGNIGPLAKLGIVLPGVKKGTADFATILDALANSSFAGLARNIDPAILKQAEFKHEVHEAEEAIGNGLLPVITQLLGKIQPYIEAFTKWAAAHKDVVLAIVGGGIAGAGLLAALTLLGQAITILATPAGPIALAITGLAALVGWIVKLKVEHGQLPAAIQETVDAIIKENAEIDKLNKKLHELPDGTEFNQIRQDTLDKLDEAKKKLDALTDSMKKFFDAGQGGTETEDTLKARIDVLTKDAARLQAQLDSMPEPFGIFKLGSKKNDVREELEKTRKELALYQGQLDILEQAKPKPAGAVPETGVGASAALSPEDQQRKTRLTIISEDKKETQEWLDAKIAMASEERDHEIESADKAGKSRVDAEVKYNKAVEDARDAHIAAMLAKERTENLQPLNEEQDVRRQQVQDPNFTGPRQPFGGENAVQTPGGPVDLTPHGGPAPTLPTDEFQQNADDIIQINDDTIDQMKDGWTDLTGQILDELDRQKAAHRQQGSAILDTWGGTFESLLNAGDAFGQAFYKSTVLTLLKIGQAKIQGALGELLITKVIEVGKALMGAPLSFGASLAAIPLILAAFGASTAALGAAEKAFSPKGSYEVGGVIPETGPYKMHAPEVVFNPKKNTMGDLVSFLHRSGSPEAADTLHVLTTLASSLKVEPSLGAARFMHYEKEVLHGPGRDAVADAARTFARSGAADNIADAVTAAQRGQNGAPVPNINLHSWGPLNTELDVERIVRRVFAEMWTEMADR